MEASGEAGTGHSVIPAIDVLCFICELDKLQASIGIK